MPCHCFIFDKKTNVRHELQRILQSKHKCDCLFKKIKKNLWRLMSRSLVVFSFSLKKHNLNLLLDCIYLKCMFEPDFSDLLYAVP